MSLISSTPSHPAPATVLRELDGSTGGPVPWSEEINGTELGRSDEIRPTTGLEGQMDGVEEREAEAEKRNAEVGKEKAADDERKQAEPARNAAPTGRAAVGGRQLRPRTVKPLRYRE